MAGPSPNDTTGPVFLSVCTSLQILTLVLVAARIRTRLRFSLTLLSHDWAILGAVIISLAEYTAVVVSISFGYGRHTQYVTPANRISAMHVIFYAEVFWYWSMTCAKISMALLLMVFKRDKAWRFFLHVIVAVLLVSAVLITCTQFFACQPVSVYWDPREFRTAVCWDRRLISANVVGFSVVQILTDLIFSFAPLTFVFGLNAPKREKVIISILMSLGLGASVTAIVRTFKGLMFPPDYFRNAADISLLAMLDLYVGIIAATLPTLKVFFERLLIRTVQLFKSDASEAEVRSRLVGMGLLDSEDEQKYDPSPKMPALKSVH